jgi:hypothetical protein
MLMHAVHADRKRPLTCFDISNSFWSAKMIEQFGAKKCFECFILQLLTIQAFGKRFDSNLNKGKLSTKL